MIDKSSQVTFISWIYDLTFGSFHQISASWFTILLKFGFSNIRVSWKYFSNVLHDELTSLDFLSCTKSPTFSSWWHRIYISILMFLKLSILTMITTITSIIITLSWHHSIQTSISTIIWYIVVLNPIILLGSWSAKTWLHLIIFWKFPLPIKIKIFLQRSKILKTIT